MSSNKCWSTKIGAKFLSDLIIFSILSSDILLDFHDSSSGSKIFIVFFNCYKY